MNSSNIYKDIIKVIKNNNSFLIASHAHPDGDGIGSTLALGMALKAMSKDVVMYNEDGVPKVVDFLPGAGEIVTELKPSEKFDVSIMVDCGQPKRAGRHFPSSDRWGRLVCIDHHVTGGEDADIRCQDENASSTGEVVYNLLKEMSIEISPELATMILTTIVVDTGFFRYSNTSSHALSIAAELVENGAEPYLISKNMEERNPPEQFRLLPMTLQTIEYILDGKAAIMTLTRQMFASAGAGVEAAEEFINFPRSVEGVEIAVLIREKSRNEFKISFRSKDIVDVAKLVSQFGGGGHKHAAGCTLKGSLGEVKQKIINAVKEVL